jgi:nucleobase:cation symporter-1, NCS1 family
VGIEAQWAWTLVFGAAALAMGLLGPIGVVRTVLRKVAVWAMPIAIGYLTWWALSGGSLSRAWHAPGEGGLSTWQAIDIVVGVTVSWVPLAADYTRFARTPRAAFWGTGIGYLVPDVLLLALGAVVLLTREVGDAAALPAAVAAGGVVALLTLIVLTVGETDEAFANAYSGAMSLQNLFPAAPQRLLIVATTGIGTLGALTLELTSFQSFLFLLGSFFVPLFAVLLADWLLSGCSYTAADVFEAPAWRLGMLAAWLVGFATYQYLSPTGPAWWVDQVDRLDPPAWGVGATLPSFAASLAVGLVAAAAARQRTRRFATTP